MSEEVRTKIPIDSEKSHYAKNWQSTQEELVSNIPLANAYIERLWWSPEKKD
jgi:hypothetical protein